MEIFEEKALPYELGDIAFGVPQGSCLGSILILVYVNDLHLSLNHSVNMSVDDTSVSFFSDSIPDIYKSVTFDLVCLKAWVELNKLSLNVTKTQTLLKGDRKTLIDIENSETQNLQMVIGK